MQWLEDFFADHPRFRGGVLMFVGCYFFAMNAGDVFVRHIWWDIGGLLLGICWIAFGLSVLSTKVHKVLTHLNERLKPVFGVLFVMFVLALIAAGILLVSGHAMLPLGEKIYNTDRIASKMVGASILIVAAVVTYMQVTGKEKVQLPSFVRFKK